jgi:serine-type D-Ala-D-Ala carboxypeptidase (penicillin-binding protein 5/6)
MVSRLLFLAVWVALALATAAFSPPAIGDGDPQGRRLGSLELAAIRGAPSVPDTVRSVASVVVDGASGHTLAAKNADARLAPASLTKMMTALVAVRRASLGDVVTATEKSRSEPSVIGLDPGDVLSLEDMLYGLMLPSGNDAALAIAESVGRGSIETFVRWMNEEAASLGLKNTRFANPHGLDEAGHYSSARDMALIARTLMAEPALATIVGTPRHVVQGPPLYLFVNSNPILGRVPAVDGIKTGFTDDAGRCFAVSATREGRRVIAVVLNSANIGVDAQLLLEAEFEASRSMALAVVRPGFASVRTEPAAPSGAPVLSLRGWEAPFLRAYHGSLGTEIYLNSRLLARW